jgi:acetyltransferase
MEALMESARTRGLKMIEGEVLTENQRMLSLMRRLGFAIRNHAEDTSLKTVERGL